MDEWIHDYYCDKDGSELIFNINNNIYFERPICHYKYEDKKRKRVWIIKYRYKIFDQLEKYSERYLLEKNSEYLTFIQDKSLFICLSPGNPDIKHRTTLEAIKK